MASILDTFNSIIQLKPVTDGFVNQIYENNPLLRIFRDGKAKQTVGGGDRIEVGLRYANVTGNHWSGRGNIVDPTALPYVGDGSNKGSLGLAKYDWSFFNAPLRIPFDKWLLVQKGRYTIEDFAKIQLEDMAQGIARQFEALLFTKYGYKTDNSTTDANKKSFGIQEIVSDTHPSGHLVGDVDEASDTWWKSYVVTYDPATPLTKQIHKVVNHMANNYGVPDIIIASEDLYLRYCDEAYDKSGYTIRDEVATKLGFQAGASFNGIPFVQSVAPNTPTNSIFFINTYHIKFVTDPEYNFKLSDFKDVSTTNYDKIAMLDTVWSIICDNRSAFAVLTGIS